MSGMMNIPDGEPAVVTMTGGDILVLGNDGFCWFVNEGAVSVFWSRTENGLPRGQRRYVGTLLVGGLALANLPFGIADEICLLLSSTGAQLTRVEPVKLPGEVMVPGVGAWASLLAEHAIESRPLYTATVSGEAGIHRLEAGQTLRIVGQGPKFARVLSGTAAPMGEIGASLEADAGWVATSHPHWFEAVDDVEIEIRTACPDDGEVALAATGTLNWVFSRFALSVSMSDEIIERRRQLLRRQEDEEQTGRTLSRLSDVITGGRPLPAAEGRLAEVISVIGKAQCIEFTVKSEGPWSNEHPVEAVCRLSRVRFRFVRLPKGWRNLDAGPLLAFLRSGNDMQPVALIRDGSGQYRVYESAAGQGAPVDGAVADKISDQAIVFYRPFPDGRITLPVLVHFIARGILPEIRWLVGAGLFMATFGLLIPLLTRYAVDIAIPDGEIGTLLTIAMALGVATLCKLGFTIFDQCLIIRIRTLAKVGLQAAIMDRLVSLPAPFFKKYDNGELLNRAMMISQIGNMVGGTVLLALFAGIMSLSNFLILFQFSASMAIAVAGYAACIAATTMGISYLIRQRSIEVEKISGKLTGFLVQLIQGVSRLRVAGAGRRAFNQWLGRFTDQVRLVGGIRFLEDLERIINLGMGHICSIGVLFLAYSISASQITAGAKGLSIGSFMAFMSAFGALVGGITSTSHAIVVLMEAFSKMRLVDPILSEPVEGARTNVIAPRLAGTILVDRVSFRYGEGLPLVLNDVSLSIQPGQFVALVGSSGCGKSTLIRLLLGLEKPFFGNILFDGRNLDGLDLPSLRRQIGVVMQAPRVAAGSIYDNIAFGNSITMDQAMEAAHSAGMADDIAQMPMGMQTMVSEGGENLSGGQRQRLMIARAMVSNPRIMIFDEATSALDNITQNIVSRSLSAMKVTRVTVAHRLSTVKDADVIYVLENGKITQSGSYEQLMSRDGLFRAMAKRQII